MKKQLFLVLFLALLLGSCSVVKEYEMQKLNDKDMALSGRKINKFDTSFQLYREAASGANGGKSGGGCGCN